jgi:5-(carboxyamino)imidazole ribonucleotide mutase
MAIGIAGATNAGLMAASILAIQDETVRATLKLWRSELTSSVPDEPKDF